MQTKNKFVKQNILAIDINSRYNKKSQNFESKIKR